MVAYLLIPQVERRKGIRLLLREGRSAPAFLAYEHADGQCDEALIKVTLKNGLYHDLANYLVKKQDRGLWIRILSSEWLEECALNPASRRCLLEHVFHAVSKSRNADEVSTTVKAFMQCDMPDELIDLLERIVFQEDNFLNSKNMQILLILTAIRANKDNNRLANFDGPEIAKIAARQKYVLDEEAPTMYIKFGRKTSREKQVRYHVVVMEVIENLIQDLERAKEIAEKINIRPVLSQLSRAQQDGKEVHSDHPFGLTLNDY